MSEITCERGIAIGAELKQGSNSSRIRMGIVVGFERKLSVVNSSLSVRFNLHADRNRVNERFGAIKNKRIALGRVGGIPNDKRTIGGGCKGNGRTKQSCYGDAKSNFVFSRTLHRPRDLVGDHQRPASLIEHDLECLIHRVDLIFRRTEVGVIQNSVRDLTVIPICAKHTPPEGVVKE